MAAVPYDAYVSFDVRKAIPRTLVIVLLASAVLSACALERAPWMEPSEPLAQDNDGGVSPGRDSGPIDDATTDSGPDSGLQDGGTQDSGSVEAGPVDGGAPDAAPDSGPGCVPAQEICDATDNDCDGLVDEDVGGVPTCPCDRQAFEESTYLFCSQTESWADARDACQDLGYELAIIETEAEDDWLSFESDLFDDAWIGLTRVRSSRYEWTDGTAVWDDDDPVGYANFWSDEPNTGRGRDCGQLTNIAGSWWMERCNGDFPYICETAAP